MQTSCARFDTIIQSLRENNHKLTPQRMAVARILAESREHPSVEDIYRKLQDAFPTMSLATVYRNVMLIKSIGEALELGFADGRSRYDGRKPEPHPHVICVRCEKILDPDLSSLKHMTDEAKKASGFEILTHRLDFFGICPECRPGH